MRKIYGLVAFTLMIITGCSLKAQDDYNQQWPQFRGPWGGGIVETSGLPDTWNVTTGENIRWKTAIPGLGHSCPVIWDDKIYLTTAISGSGTDSLKAGYYGDVSNVEDVSEHEFRLLCIDKKSGSILWNQLVHKGVPVTKRHTKASHADPTAATNGKYVVAFFGSNGLYCYTAEGQLVWKKDFGKMNSGYYYTEEMEWDISSSPIIQQNTVLVQCDFLGESFLTAIDLETGNEKWRVKRDDVSSYGAPCFYNNNGQQQVIVNGYKHIGAYDFITGKEIWKMNGGGDIPVPTPFVADSLVYIHSAHGRYSPIYAINANATGDITLGEKETSNKYIKWSIKRGAAYIPTAIVYRNYLYNLSEGSGKLTCYDAKTGEKQFEERIPEAATVTASGIASDGKLYFATEEGVVLVVKAGDKYDLIACNPLNEVVMATPAISGKSLYFRTQHYLIAVGKD